MHDENASSKTRASSRILIVDDQPLIRRGLTALIDNEPDLRVCAAAASYQGTLPAIVSTKPEMVIVDLSTADGKGLALVKSIRSVHVDLLILALSMHDAVHWARRTFRAGANGYASKAETGETLLIAIRCVLRGERYVSPRVKGGLDLT